MKFAKWVYILVPLPPSPSLVKGSDSVIDIMD